MKPTHFKLVPPAPSCSSCGELECGTQTRCKKYDFIFDGFRAGSEPDKYVCDDYLKVELKFNMPQ